MTFPTPLPLLPLRAGVLLPGATVTLPVGRARSRALVESLKAGDLLGVVVQRDGTLDEPALADLLPIGTIARVHEIARARDGFRVVLEGLERFHLHAVVRSAPFFLGDGALAPSVGTDAPEVAALARSLVARMTELAEAAGGAIDLGDASDGGMLADRAASVLSLPAAEEAEVLLTLDVPTRLRAVIARAEASKASLEVKRSIDAEVRRGVGKSQRESILREQLRAIKKELGDDAPGDALDALRERIAAAGLPDETRKAADRELARLEAIPAGQPEHNVIRTWLEWVADLPWDARAPASDDLDRVAQKLDEDHFGLGDVKRRILEHMAVLKLAGTSRGTILCLAGPPGVGKTSLGQSIADATGRPFVRISLGGVRDEAEVRGHRRTYVGALPGRVLHALRKAKVKNPIVLLDEIDKLSQGYMGSPESALLEVLDPEQNKTFVDHYLEQPFDLSEVVFLATANDLSTLSPPLRDRLEIIDITGYTAEEKAVIARKHVIPRELARHGVAPERLVLSDGALSATIRDYTREAGVRQLTREIGKLCRAVALSVARDAAGAVVVGESDLARLLGKPRFFADVAERTSVPGVATGLAWTPVGGDILFIETTRMPGKGGLEITGQLGDVMKESARAALSFVRSNAGALGVDPSFLGAQDLHLHVPAGGVPKDGPSAGVTIFTALTSLLTGRRVRSDTAMTGEVTLRGRVLPVGGIKAKVLAAHRAGLTRVVLPRKNQRDLEDVPEEVRKALEIVFADDMHEVLAAALEPEAIAPREQTSSVRAAA